MIILFIHCPFDFDPFILQDESQGDKLKDWWINVEVLFAIECQNNFQAFFVCLFVFSYIWMQWNYSRLNDHYGKHPSFFRQSCPFIACVLVVPVLVMSNSCLLYSPTQKCDDTNRHWEVGHHLSEKLGAGSPCHCWKFCPCFLALFFTFNPPSYLIQWADLLWLSLPFIHNRSDNTSHSLLHLSSLPLFFSSPHCPLFFFLF